jgi:cobalamin biosynthesis protein CbiD
MKDMSHDDFDKLINDPESMQELASDLYKKYKDGHFKDKSDVRRRAKNWMENRDKPVAAPRGDQERAFQQSTTEEAQKILKRRGMNISIADIQAALWFHEKELFNKFKIAKGKAVPADYEDAAKNAMETIKKGELYRVKSKEKKVAKAHGGFYCTF